VWWVRDRLDVERIREAARRFEGRHDFRSFAASDDKGGSTLVEVRRIEVGEAGDLLLIRVQGSHFLWKMVRRMMGVLAEVGRGALGPAEVERLLREESPVPAKHTAPPSGLFLERVFYEGEGRERLLEPVLNLFTGGRP
jgi:tRNA pseudouridine38-40 synthase